MLPEIAYRSAPQAADDAVEVSFMVPCLNEEANVVGDDRDDHERHEPRRLQLRDLGIRRRIAGQYRGCRRGLSSGTPASACPAVP